MAFLKLSSLFDSAAKPPTKEVIGLQAKRARMVGNGQPPEDPRWPQIERRSGFDRRSADRREKKQPTFLETRKIQGRRHSSGRRKTDKVNSLSPFYISVKG